MHGNPLHSRAGNQLSRLANEAGTAPEQVVTKLVASYLDGEARFLAAVDKGLAAAERGEFIEEEEMDARIDAMLSADANPLDATCR